MLFCDNHENGCKYENRYNKSELKKHFEECEFYNCKNKRNGCKFIGTRKKREEHYNEDCEYFTCNFIFSGCREIGKKIEIEKHISECSLNPKMFEPALNNNIYNNNTIDNSTVDKGEDIDDEIDSAKYMIKKQIEKKIKDEKEQENEQNKLLVIDLQLKLYQRDQDNLKNRQIIDLMQQKLDVSEEEIKRKNHLVDDLEMKIDRLQQDIDQLERERNNNNQLDHGGLIIYGLDEKLKWKEIDILRDKKKKLKDELKMEKVVNKSKDMELSRLKEELHQKETQNEILKIHNEKMKKVYDISIFIAALIIILMVLIYLPHFVISLLPTYKDHISINENILDNPDHLKNKNQQDYVENNVCEVAADEVPMPCFQHRNPFKEKELAVAKYVKNKFRKILKLKI